MKTQTSQFAVVTKQGIVTSTILQPKTDYRGNGMKWLQDCYKDGRDKNGRNTNQLL